MDAFYASVELIDRPELVGRPVIVGGASPRAVVLSATYEARALGVHSAMPMGRALRLAPRAVVIEPDHRRYTRVSEGIMAVFGDITPYVEPLSLDEAFLDVSGAVRRLGSPAAIAALIRARIRDEQGITCSVGAASTKFVAKLASTQAKPDGLLVVAPSEVVAFLHPLPIGALWGVGERTEQALVRRGLLTVGDVAQLPVETLQRTLGPAAGAHLAALAWGRDPRRVDHTARERSIGAEETFPRDVTDVDVLARELLRLSERVARRLRAANLVGRTVALKVRDPDFTTVTRSRSLRDPTDVAKEIYATACSLLAGLGRGAAPTRLVGVRVEGLTDVATASRQLTFGAADHGWRDAERAVDRLADRFGKGSVLPASLVAARGDGSVVRRATGDEPSARRPPGDDGVRRREKKGVPAPPRRRGPDR
ncbi:MAG: DNA polymerase IV [Actinomycetota bacterium]|nr:MAG: DNA polymerase IV [Actinomycetota bacterium]